MSSGNHAVTVALGASEASVSSPAPDIQHFHGPVEAERRFRGRFGRARILRPALREGAPTREVAHRERIGRLTLAIADAVAAATALSVVIAWSGGSPLWGPGIAVPVILAANKVAGLYERDDLVLNKTTLDEA